MLSKIPNFGTNQLKRSQNMCSQILVILEISHLATSVWIGAGIRWPPIEQGQGSPCRVWARGY